MTPKQISSSPSKTDSIKDSHYLDGFVKQLMAEHICALVQMYAIHGVKHIDAIDLIYDIIFVDPITI